MRDGESTLGGVSLRPLEVSDAPAMVEVLASSELYEFTGGSAPTLAELRQQYEEQARGVSPDGQQQWLNWIVLSESGEPVGYVQATRPMRGTTAEIAWVIGRPWQGRGYATRAGQLMLAELRDLGVREVVAHIHADHAASHAVATRLGLSPTDELVDGEIRWQGRLPESAPDGAQASQRSR